MSDGNDVTTAAARSTTGQIVAELDLATKVRLLSGNGFWSLESIPSHGLDGIDVADGPHGLRFQQAAADHLGVAPAAPATCFPTAAALGSTWDVDVLAEVGGAIGEEAAHLGVSVILGPGLNIKRHPAGGRCFEYLSEDPHLSGKLAAAMVQGVQQQGVGTSIKHFAVNNQESHRLVLDAVVDERTLREIYLTGFEIVVREASPWTVMCAYNQVNGTYASEHRELLQSILRDEWGFDGLVMTDWGAASDRVAGIGAGLDLEMPSSEKAYDRQVLDAVADGRLSEAAVDACAGRVVDLLRRGLPRGVTRSTDHDANHQIARRAAAAGSVLLVNNGVLPLSPTGRIAVIGAFATEPRYQGAGSSQVDPTRLDRALDALRDRVGPDAEITHSRGFDPKTGAATSATVADAVNTALAADVAVLFAGLPAPAESEGFDRTTLDLPEGQVRLIEALAATTTPLVVVLNNGGVVHLPWTDRVDAVLECWLGGQAGGSAVVDVLLGDAEPGGRLAESVPEHVAQLPADRNFPGSPRQVQYREGLYVGYRFHDSAGVPARFPFGAGLSYTTFEWTDISVTGSGTDVSVQVRVTNTGERAGSDVVQVYVRDVEASVHRPEKELKGFAKVHLGPGESESVAVRLDRRSFAVWDVAAHDWLVEAGAFEIVVGRSSVQIEEVLGHDVASDDVVTKADGPAAYVATDDEFAAMMGRPISPRRCDRSIATPHWKTSRPPGSDG
jgi:beta-glucosidase